jgi:hypothetical protein
MDYSKMVIYKIEHNTNKELVYVGSTTNFRARKCHHKNGSINPNNKNYDLKVYQMIRDNGGWEAFQMLEVKKFPCLDGNEAHAEEEKCRIELKANLNTNKAHKTKEEEQERLKKYREENQEHIKEIDKAYREKNQEQIKEQKRLYQIENKERLNEISKKWRENLNAEQKKELLAYKKEWYEKNKETIKTKNSQKVICECGKEYSLSNKARHLKTHINSN